MVAPLWQLLIGRLLSGDLLGLALQLGALNSRLLGGDLLALAAPLWQLGVLVSELLGVVDHLLNVLDGVLKGFLVLYGGEDVDGEGVGAIHDQGLSRT